jgi:hypothetical protein
MYFLSGDMTIRTKLGLREAADSVAHALGIPPFVKDESGRWEEQEVYLSHCFGLEFVFGQTPDGPPGEYGLSIDSDTDMTRYNGMETEVDATRYALQLIQREPALEASAG